MFCPMYYSKYFDWLVVHFHLSTFGVLGTVKANRKQKPITKKLAGFHNQFALLTTVKIVVTLNMNPGGAGI